MKKITRGTIRAFDVDFAQCECKGTLHQRSGMQVVAVKWKRTDKDPNGRVRFQCMRCKTAWSMNNVAASGDSILLDPRHPEEVARRLSIDTYYDDYVAVNTRQRGDVLGTCSGRVSCSKPQ